MKTLDRQAIAIRDARARRAAPPAPRRLMLQLTNKCNSRCTMCSIWRIYPEGWERLSDELSSAEWITLIGKAVAAGARQIDLTGGEPFLKDGIEEIVTTVLRALGFTSIVTNAVLPDSIAAKIERIVSGMAPEDNLSVTVSLDGFEAASAEVRGLPDAYQRTRLLLEHLAELRQTAPGLAVNVSFTMQQANLADLEPLLESLLADGLLADAGNFHFRPAASGAYYRATNPALQPAVAIEAIERVQRGQAFDADKSAFLNGVKIRLAEPKRMILPCYAMFASCWIDPYGNVSPCVTMTEEILGNVRDHDLSLGPIWHSARAATQRSRISDDNCAVCWTECQAYENLFFAQPDGDVTAG